MTIPRALAGALVAIVVTAGGGNVASAHEENAGTRAVDLVHQAIGILGNRPHDLDAARQKLEAARASRDQAGVDMTLVDQAGVALARGDVGGGLALLDRAVAETPGADRPLRLPPRGTRETVLLLASVATALLGVALAVRYRPPHRRRVRSVAR